VTTHATPAGVTLPHPAVRGSAREVLTLAWPAVINMLSVTLMGTVDAYLVGRIGTAEQGAVGFSNTFMWSIWCFFLGTLVLVQTFVAQHTGAGQPNRAAHAASAGIKLAGLFSIVPLVAAFFGRPLFELCGVDAEMIPHADVYYRIRMVGSGFLFLTYVWDAYFRGIGDTITPMYATVAANVANAVLAYFLIFGLPGLGIPAMGVFGAGLATTIALFLHVAIYWMIARRRKTTGLPAPSFREPVTRGDIDELLRVGVPSGVHWLLDIGAWTVFTMKVATLGAVEAAANMIGIMIIRMSFLPGYGVGTAAQTLVGQYLGAGDIASARRSGRTAMIIATTYMGIMGLVFFTMPAQLVSLFTDDPDVIRVGQRLILWAALFQLTDGVQVVLGSALRGAGDTKFVMWSGIVGSWLVFVPIAFYLMEVRKMGSEGGWIGVIAWAGALAILLLWRFRGDAWTKGGINLEPRPVPEGEVA
jgi:MATE family multidrug resistance protein